MNASALSPYDFVEQTVERVSATWSLQDHEKSLLRSAAEADVSAVRICQTGFPVLIGFARSVAFGIIKDTQLSTLNGIVPEAMLKSYLHMNWDLRGQVLHHFMAELESAGFVVRIRRSLTGESEWLIPERIFEGKAPRPASGVGTWNKPPLVQRIVSTNVIPRNAMPLFIAEHASLPSSPIAVNFKDAWPAVAILRHEASDGVEALLEIFENQAQFEVSVRGKDSVAYERVAASIAERFEEKVRWCCSARREMEQDDDSLSRGGHRFPLKDKFPSSVTELRAQRSTRNRFSKVDMAITYVMKTHDVSSVSAVARAIGCSKSFLSTNKRFQTVWEKHLETQMRDIEKGHRTTGGVERNAKKKTDD